MSTAVQDADQGVNSYPASFAPDQYRKTPLSRVEMAAIIDKGESVMFGGRIITHHSHLPSDALLASGDRTKADPVIAAMREQIAADQKRLDALEASVANKPAGSSGESQAAHEAIPIVPSDAGSVVPKTTPTLNKQQDEEMKAAQRAALLKGAPPAESVTAVIPKPGVVQAAP